MATPRPARRPIQRRARSASLSLSDVGADLHRRSLSDQIANALVRYILDREMRPGDAMPSTAELVEQLGVSRNVVREAIADLSGKGILRRAQGRECVVGEPGSRELHDLLSFRVSQQDHDPMEVHQLREALEVMSAQLAAVHHQPEHLEVLAAQLETMQTTTSTDQFLDADNAFHRELAEASGNRLLLLVLDSLEPLLRTDRRRMWSESSTFSRRDAIAAHENVYQAIESGDPDESAAAMRRHLRLAESYLHTATPSRGRSGGARPGVRR